jgi:hypothetical protein
VCEALLDPETVDEFDKALHRCKTNAEDTLLVYYAGHGLPLSRDGSLHLALGETDRERLHATAYPVDWIREALRQSNASAKVVILDCCFSGRAIQTLSHDAVAEQVDVAGSFVLTATPANKLALAPEGEKYTAFTGALVEILRLGVPDGGEYLDLDTVFRCVKKALADRGLPEPNAQRMNEAARLALARNIAAAPSRPANVEGLRKALLSIVPADRLQAIKALEELADAPTGGDLAGSLELLKEVVDRDDSAMVRETADAALARLGRGGHRQKESRAVRSRQYTDPQTAIPTLASPLLLASSLKGSGRLMPGHAAGGHWVTLNVRVHEDTVVGEFRSRNEEQETQMERLNLSSRNERTIEALVETLGNTADEASESKSGKHRYHEVLAGIGGELYELLFSGEIGAVLRANLDAVREGAVDLLRVRMAFRGWRASWLDALPWEALYLPESARSRSEFLLESYGVTLTRYPPAPSVDRPGIAEPPLSVLLLAPTPQDLPAVDQESLPVLKKFAASGEIRLHCLAEGVSNMRQRRESVSMFAPDRLTEAMEDCRPLVVHYVGHVRVAAGWQGECSFTSADGGVDWMAAEELAERLSASEKPDLVILEAGSVSPEAPHVGLTSVARTLAVQGIPGIVGCPSWPQSGHSRAFVQGLYTALLDSVPIDVALARARASLASDQGVDPLLPAAYIGRSDRLVGSPPTVAPSPAPLMRQPVVADSPHRCPMCDSAVEPFSRFCGACGASLVSN